jgi:GNAT superfamily N-acetyltransferase
MTEIHCEPPLPAKSGGVGFVQTISLLDGKALIGAARWHCAAVDDDGEDSGVVQVLELSVLSPHRRRGSGRRLMDAVFEQANEFFRRRGSRLKKVWIGVEQKGQVNARAFLTSRGFHHIGGAVGLFRDQELMVYVKSLV